MLTVRCAKASAPWHSAARAGAVLTLSAISVFATWSPAQAGAFSSGGCVGTWSGFSCGTQWGRTVNPFIRIVPQPFGEAEQARALARDQRWLAHCRPVVALDRYGVPRYHYAAPGCEFGVGED